ncbi:hypothetical protein, partial [Streptomyces monomycini]|uniref:hypothetical protein n=1 Tax=Streptomyces monomycini TaxID=371720 RepID=UPI001EEC40EF
MKRHGRPRRSLLLKSTLAATLLTGATCGLPGISPAARASATEPPELVEKASFSLDEGVGAGRVSGGVPGEFIAELGGGAELGAAGKSGSALRLNGSSGFAATAGPVVDTTKSFS